MYNKAHWVHVSCWVRCRPLSAVHASASSKASFSRYNGLSVVEPTFSFHLPLLDAAVLPSRQSNVEVGAYALSFFVKGQWNYVLIDDYLPCDSRGQPIFARCADADEYWVPTRPHPPRVLHLLTASFVHRCNCLRKLTPN